jgi:membrane protein implicated in regulation of membrane protease activity
MLGVYLFSTILGLGLLVASLIGSSDADSDFDLDADADVDFDLDLEVDADSGLLGDVGDIVLGLFKPRNLTFLLAAFGTTGLLLTWTAKDATSTFVLASVMGAGAWLLTHAVFTWLHRTDSSVDVLSDRDLEGSIGTVTLPISPGTRGRITIVAAGQQTYLTARLNPGLDRALPVGTEVLIRRTENGVAEVIPTDTLDLPPSTS